MKGLRLIPTRISTPAGNPDPYHSAQPPSPSLLLQPLDLPVPRSHHHFLPLPKPCPELKLKILLAGAPAPPRPVPPSSRSLLPVSPLRWPFLPSPLPAPVSSGAHLKLPEAGLMARLGRFPRPPARTSPGLLQPRGLYVCLARSRKSQTLKMTRSRSSATEDGTGWLSEFHDQR